MGLWDFGTGGSPVIANPDALYRGEAIPIMQRGDYGTMGPPVIANPGALCRGEGLRVLIHQINSNSLTIFMSQNPYGECGTEGFDSSDQFESRDEFYESKPLP